MRYAAIIIMNNGTKYFLNGLWNHDHEARESIQEWLDHKFMNCVTAENETAFINCDSVSSIEILDFNEVNRIRANIIENKKYQPENLFRCLATLYKD